MFKNPLKYKSGGVTQSKEQEAENQLLFAIAEGLGAQPEQVKARLEQIKSNPDELKELQSALQLMQQDQNAGFQAVLKLFAKPQSAKHGAKIQDFICKHKRGGYVAGCGCKEEVKKSQHGGFVRSGIAIPVSRNTKDVERKTRLGDYHTQTDILGKTAEMASPAGKWEEVFIPNKRAVALQAWGNSDAQYRNANGYPIEAGYGYGNDYVYSPEYIDMALNPAQSLSPRVDVPKIDRITRENKNGGIVKGQEGIPSINALRYVEREYDPEGNAVYTMAKTRETLPSNMRSNALSEYSQNGGEYQGNGQIQITDFGNGKTRVNGDPYGAPVEVLLHGNDSTEALNRLRQLAKVANIKLGPAIREKGGKVEKAQWGGITTGNERTNSNNRGQYWEDLTINPEFGRTYRLTVPGGMINGKYIRHISPNGTNVIKSTSILSSHPSIRWSNVFVPGMKDYSWKDFYFNHMKKNVPQRLSNAQRLVPPIYDVKNK